jgi:hypothetical protein
VLAKLPFTLLSPGIAMGEPIPEGWQTLADRPLVIIVGVTGVGKSTTLNKLAKTNCSHTLLPNRRELTDRLIIPYIQTIEGVPIQTVTDRRQRFDFTRRYRTYFPGGMSHALTQLWIDLSQMSGLLIFDGLRGAEEVGHAVTLLPHAHFIVLHAPDVVRVQRLLERKDEFDRVAAGTPMQGQPELRNLASLGVTETSPIFTVQEEESLLALVQRGEANADDLRAKLQIVLEERRNYDPYAAIQVLQAQAPDRALVIDTTQHWPDQVVDQIVKRLRDWLLESRSSSGQSNL